MRTPLRALVALVVAAPVACSTTPPPGDAGPSHPEVVPQTVTTAPAEPPVMPEVPREPAARDDAPAPAPPFTPFGGITVIPAVPAVEVQGWVCLDSGWLEQVACGPNSREHESLVVIKARPSDLHAAMLLAGFEPGAPGSWRLEGEELVLTPPRGSPLEVRVRYEGPAGPEEHSVRRWIRDHHGRQEFPGDPWVFAGSLIAANTEWMGPGEHYVADYSGSIIGLVTFGDEVIGFSRVLSDKQDVQPPEWEAWTERLPPIGTEVTLIIRGTNAAPSALPAAGEEAP